MLNERQKAFADYFLKLGNATEAAISAGYKPKYAGTNADKLLKNTKIQEYIENRQKQIESERIASIEEVMRFYSSVMRGEVTDQFGLEASLDTRLSAGKELMRRYNAVKNDDGRIDRVAQIMARLDAESGVRSDVER